MVKPFDQHTTTLNQKTPDALATLTKHADRKGQARSSLAAVSTHLPAERRIRPVPPDDVTLDDSDARLKTRSPIKPNTLQS